jgi:hypothetical protein
MELRRETVWILALFVGFTMCQGTYRYLLEDTNLYTGFNIYLVSISDS